MPGINCWKPFPEERISWVNPGNDHITLRFIGDTKVSAIDGIGTKLLEEVSIPGKFELCFSRPG